MLSEYRYLLMIFSNKIRCNQEYMLMVLMNIEKTTQIREELAFNLYIIFLQVIE